MNARSGSSQDNTWNETFLAKFAEMALLSNVSVATWLSSSDVESWRHRQSYGDGRGKPNRLRNTNRLRTKYQE